MANELRCSCCARSRQAAQTALAVDAEVARGQRALTALAGRRRRRGVELRALEVERFVCRLVRSLHSRRMRRRPLDGRSARGSRRARRALRSAPSTCRTRACRRVPAARSPRATRARRWPAAAKPTSISMCSWVSTHASAIAPVASQRWRRSSARKPRPPSRLQHRHQVEEVEPAAGARERREDRLAREP